MNIRDLNGKRVCILGYGREGQAMVRALETFAPNCEITVADKNPDIVLENEKHRKQVGGSWLENLDTFDVLIVSPGIPPHVLPITNTPLTNSTQIFLDSIDPRATVVGITGSKGKSTTASLLHHILKTAGRQAILVGNIGDAAIAKLNEVTKHTIVVLEMSSYQLMRIHRSPQVAIVTSFFPEHLDYHGSLEAYKDAKKNITRFQAPEDIVYYYEHSEGAADIASVSSGTKTSYNDQDSPLAVQDTKLIGTHNLCNIAAAAAAARHFDIADETIAQAARTFAPLSHRLQYIGTIDGIHWVDDAISTTPESAIAAIHALSPRVKTIILGGQDRGNDYSALADVLIACGVRHAITMGESGPRIAATLKNTDVQLYTANTMAEAVKTAKAVTGQNETGIPICLLSPASPGYDMYKNFEEKGADYAKVIQNS